MKKYFLYLFIGLLVFSSYCRSEYVISEEFDRFSVIRYNSLPLPENANVLLKQRNFSAFFKDAQILAQEYKFDSFFGLRLLHNHTFLDENSIMVESTQTEDNNVLFVTKPFLVDELKEKNFVPASWIPGKADFTVFEYSSDLDVVNNYEKVQKTPEFLTKFHRLIYQYEIQDLIAPAIIGESKLKEIEKLFDLEQNMKLIEETYVDPFQSVVTIRDKSKYDTAATLIDTMWPLILNPNSIKCGTYCSAGFQCISTSYGHAERSYHSRIHGYVTSN